MKIKKITESISNKRCQAESYDINYDLINNNLFKILFLKKYNFLWIG